MDKLSYALGLSLGQSLIGSGVKELNFDDFLSGVKTIFSGEDPAISEQYANQILTTFLEKVNKEKEEKQKREREINLKIAEELLETHSKNEGVQVTSSGLQYKVLTKGDETKTPSSHSRVKVHYEGRLINGTVFDSSYERGEPVVFSLEQVIPGWTEGLQLMTPGSKYEFTIPPALGYGEVGVPGHIPGNSVLIFTVELLNIL